MKFISTNNYRFNGGGGHLDGIVITEMRLRKAANIPVIKTSAISAKQIAPVPGEDFVNFAGNIEVGSDGAGYDVTFHSDTSGDKLFWDTSEKSLRVIGTSGNPALYVAGGHLDIQATDDSTDATGDTGALRCEGGDNPGFCIRFKCGT